MICRKLLYLCTFVVLCVSCRTEDMYLSSIDENISNKFVVFTKRAEGKEVDYAKGFKVLAYRYDSLYDQNHTGKKAFELVSNGKLTSASYLEFRVHTELVVEDNGDKWLVFPRVQSGNVVDLIYAGLTQDETYVVYRLIDKHSEFYKVYVSDFQKGIAYLSTKSSARNGGDDVTEIDTVVIPPKKGGNNVSFIMPDFSGGISDGGCDAYSNCIPGGMGGGGGSPKPRNHQDPCKKVSDKLNNPKVTPKINELKNNAKLNGEKGFKIKANGEPSAMIDGGEGSHAVNMGDMSGYEGVYHNHPVNGTPMFSVQDIENLLYLALFQGNGNQGNAYSGLTGAATCSSCPGGYYNFHYIMQYTGVDYNELGQFVNNAQWDSDEIRSYYVDLHTKLMYGPNHYYNYQYNNLSHEGVEKLFFGVLDEMGLKDKVSLKRVNANNEVENITVDSNNNIKVKPCN